MAKHVVGLTGTLRRRDGRHPIVQMQCGPVVDRQVPMLARMFDKRLKAYRAMGYSLADEVATTCEAGGTIV